jgi:hypothetical protein
MLFARFVINIRASFCILSLKCTLPLIIIISEDQLSDLISCFLVVVREDWDARLVVAEKDSGIMVLTNCRS